MRDKSQPDNDESIAKIDPLNLDKECIRLPDDYLRYARHSADLRREVDRLKAELDVVEADIARDIRNRPAKYNMEKVTEGSIKETILLQQTHQDAVKAVRKAEYEQALCQAVVWALEHKKRSLTLLVELHGMGYFSNPKLSERGQRAVEEMTKSNVRPRRRIEDD